MRVSVSICMCGCFYMYCVYMWVSVSLKVVCVHVCVCEDVKDGRDLNIYSQAKEKVSVGREKLQGKPINPWDLIGDGRILKS